MSIWGFEAIGTRWEIVADEPLPASELVAVTAVIARFDAEWSRFRADSVVSRLRAHGGAVPAPEDATVMLELYRELSTATGGAVNPLIGAGLEALGYDADFTLHPGEPQAAPRDWERMLRLTSSELTLREPATIDIGALGKGRLVDLVAETLATVPGRLIVDAGGDLRVRGGSARVGLEHPYDPTSAIGVVEVADRALCASAVNRRAWGDGLHHVLDARTGRPVRTWAATWAIADDAMHADAIATALFFDGGAELAARWGVDWVRMSTDGRAEWSHGFDGELFGTEPAP
ncbi:thiamine biosynthesis lipoprotein [Microbacterium sp. W4I4]|uniref:FAD:protein FMN transferase n=1 Tax=Microbacterium sp. W4I4 TaxID=3042295 RepID=UPI00278B832C|nr:FAD:protein FMN transferase [Microbacterium sp. W4I4]MDQ0615852.1 thiamine biosynthesis lipoprotein [Microbacterium sp. W4I4]